MKIDLFAVERELLKGCLEAIEAGRDFTEEEKAHYAAFEAVQALRLWKEVRRE